MSTWIDRLRQAFVYEDGQLIWNIIGRGIPYGKPAGSQRPDGRVKIYFERRCYYASRLIWAYHYGRLPKEVDHINRDVSDNHITNLREATPTENKLNRNPDKGVVFHHGKWQVRIKHNGRIVFSGRYDDSNDAQAAYRAKLAELQVATFGKVQFNLTDGDKNA